MEIEEKKHRIAEEMFLFTQKLDKISGKENAVIVLINDGNGKGAVLTNIRDVQTIADMMSEGVNWAVNAHQFTKGDPSTSLN